MAGPGGAGAVIGRTQHPIYARIQDIHLVSNVVERWLGLARIKIQTASGSAKAEMTIEGVPQFEALPTEGLDRVLAYTDAMADDARLTLAVAALGGISLFVGAVGILTIMTIAVTERTAEITALPPGLMKAKK